MNFQKIISSLIAFCLGVNLLFAQFKNHGPQVFAAAIQGSHFVKDKSGNEYLFTVVRGVPARLVGYDLKTNKVIINAELPGTDGSWDMEVSTDNTVYASGNGKIYSYKIGESKINDLGFVLPNQKVVWDLVAGKDGKIYGGTYPDCQIFEYCPINGFSDVGQGAVMEGENYVRSLVYDPKNHKIYAGVGSHAGFIEVDLKTKKKKNLLSEQDKDHEFVYDMELIDGVKGGDRIFAWLNSAKGLETFIYNITTGKYEKRMPSIEIKSMAKSQDGKRIFYTAGGKVFKIDFEKDGLQPQHIASIEGRGRAGFMDKKGNYKVLTANHRIYTIDIQSGKILDELLLEVPSSPISIQTIFWGPDNKVWSSGYLAGNHGAYDPKTGMHSNYPGLHQTEGMNSLGNKIYFGNYTKAEIYSYDVTKAWSTKDRNPKFLGAIKNQDRPFAVLPLNTRQEVLFGTITGYGQLGGAIAHLDVNTEKLTSFENIIENHGITSLIEIDGRIIGGTTIFGGLGAVPIEERGKLFEWDAANKKVLWTDSIADYWSVSGLFIGPDKALWGFADATLFRYDLETKKVTLSKEIYKYKDKPSHIWRNGLAVSHPNGLIYFTLMDKLYSYNIANDELKYLRDNCTLMILGADHKIYYRVGTDLWSYSPEGY